MQFFISTILFVLVGLAAAAPAEIVGISSLKVIGNTTDWYTTIQETRSSISVTYCENTDLRSACTSVSVQSGQCTSTSGNVVSFVPSGTKCTLYSGGGCSGDSRAAGPSPALNLAGFQTSSFTCQSYSDSWGGW